MYKVLIVDDEAMQRRSLAGLVRKLRPDYGVAQAPNGAVALRMALADDFDIVIADIRMPVMDGLAFLDELHRHAERTRTLILSAYADFEYARKAIAAGVSDYVIKPVDGPKLERALQNVEALLEKACTERERADRLARQLRAAQPSYREGLLNGWLSGSLNARELAAVRDLFPPDAAGVLLLAELERGEDPHRQDSHAARRSEKACRTRMEKRLGCLGNLECFRLRSQPAVLAAVLAFASAKKPLLERVEKAAQETVDELACMNGTRIRIGMSGEASDILLQVGRAEEEALAALRQGFYGDRSVTQFNEGNCPAPAEGFLIEYVDDRALGDAVASADEWASRERMGAIVDEMALIAPADPDRLRAAVVAVLEGLFSRFRLAGDQANDANTAARALDSRHVTELRTVAVENVGALARRIAGFRAVSGDSSAAQWGAYIAEHHPEELSLVSVAAVFGYSPCYFSTLFKCAMGMGFSEYLAETRLRRSEHLLRDGGLNVSAVSEMVGYHNVKYFSRLFRQHYGLPPDHYRRALLRGPN